MTPYGVDIIEAIKLDKTIVRAHSDDGNIPTRLRNCHRWCPPLAQLGSNSYQARQLWFSAPYIIGRSECNRDTISQTSVGDEAIR